MIQECVCDKFQQQNKRCLWELFSHKPKENRENVSLPKNRGRENRSRIPPALFIGHNSYTTVSNVKKYTGTIEVAKSQTVWDSPQYV